MTLQGNGTMMTHDAADLFQKWVEFASECEEDAKSADREDGIRFKTEARVLRRCAKEMAIAMRLEMASSMRQAQ